MKINITNQYKRVTEMNAYEKMLKGIKHVLDNCTAYRVSKDLNINARTINRYQNGTSPIENMSLETAGKIYNYYTKNKERLEMKKYDLTSYGFGVGSEIQVENGVIEELARFYNRKEDMIQRQ